MSDVLRGDDARWLFEKWVRRRRLIGRKGKIARSISVTDVVAIDVVMAVADVVVVVVVARAVSMEIAPAAKRLFEVVQ